MRNRNLFIASSGEKGRGVFTKKSLPAHTEIEIAPVIVLSPEDREVVEQTKLFYYIFEWGADETQAIVALGYVSMYNHDENNNCEYAMDYGEETISIITTRDIEPGEELTINYTAGFDREVSLWFDDANNNEAEK